MSASEELQTRCVIVGGGPAGMMAGYLLARAGVQVAVLEKHADFNRDFRGDTIHPSTLELMYELGLLDEFLKQPHQEVRELRAVVNGQVVPIADFTKLPTRCKFIAFMPQWDFLNFISTHSKGFPNFQLHMQTEVVDLLIDNGRVTGVRARRAERSNRLICAWPAIDPAARWRLVQDGIQATSVVALHLGNRFSGCGIPDRPRAIHSRTNHWVFLAGTVRARIGK